jgi:YgiT-type zinc finger domain-containing protein
MICANCGKKTARVRKASQLFGSGRSAFVVEGVPEIVCSSCREHYFSLQTLKELERIRRNWRKLTVPKSMRVVRFGGAA